MKFIKTKAILFLIFLISIIFFTNDFSLIDIERTAIITAVAIDYNKTNEEYEITAQIAVPEATDTNSENTKTQLLTTGKTMASAIKHIGSATGWFPQLYFCNLIVIGNEIGEENVIKTVDYFAKSLRVQDSASIVIASGTAKDLLNVSSPLDSMSSFAIQKVILKKDSFDRDVMLINIKDFVADYYGISHSSFMPIVKKEEQKDADGNKSESENSGESSGGKEDKEKKCVFDTRETAVFLDGVMVGKLDKDLTFTFNLMHKECKGSEIVLENVFFDGENKNVLTVIKKNNCKKYLTVDDFGIVYNVDLNINLQIRDQTASKSDATYAKDLPVPKEVIDSAKTLITKNVVSLFQKEKESKSDFLKIKENIYRYHTKFFDKYKENFLDKTTLNVNVNIT